jgi:hypothetical protein
VKGGKGVGRKESIRGKRGKVQGGKESIGERGNGGEKKKSMYICIYKSGYHTYQRPHRKCPGSCSGSARAHKYVYVYITNSKYHTYQHRHRKCPGPCS